MLATENRRFVDTIIKGRRRFEALRDFTVEGAESELDRLTMERKDAGESASIRNSSQEFVRSPTSTRSPSLDNVPEDSAFAIGDDDEDNESNAGDNGLPSATSATNDAEEDALPLQSRNMSEKARGKQPIGHGNFSRSTSRNTSNTSLPSLVRLPTRGSQHPFSPDYQWVSNHALYHELEAPEITILFIASHLATPRPAPYNPPNDRKRWIARPLKRR